MADKDWAETAVIASALLDEDAFYDVVSRLGPNDFQDPRNKVIFQVMLDLHTQKIRPDLVTLTSALKTRDLINDAGGEDYVKSLADDLPPIAEVDNYIQTVKNNAVLKTFKETLHSIETESLKSIPDIPSFVTDSLRKIADVAAQSNIGGFKNSSQVLEALLGRLEEESQERIKTGKKSYLSGLATGFPTLDKYTNGFQKGDLIIVAARPSVGKTALAINFAKNVAKNRIPVAFFSLEMSAEQIMGRLLANESDLSKDEIQSLDFKTSLGENGKKIIELADSEKDNPEAIARIKALKTAVENLSQLPLYIDDSPDSRVFSIEAEVKKLLNGRPDLGLVIIDYLGLIQSAGSRVSSQENRQQVVSDISRALKGMARNLRIPVIALSQLSRESDKRTDHTPVLSDLRDSGAIEQDADQVMLIYRPDAYSDNDSKDANGGDDKGLENDVSNVKLILAKNRNGRTGEINLVFEKPKSRFTEQAMDADVLPNEEPDYPQSPDPTQGF
mgnify:FL=1